MHFRLSIVYQAPSIIKTSRKYLLGDLTHKTYSSQKGGLYEGRGWDTTNRRARNVKASHFFQQTQKYPHTRTMCESSEGTSGLRGALDNSVTQLSPEGRMQFLAGNQECNASHWHQGASYPIPLDHLSRALVPGIKAVTCQSSGSCEKAPFLLGKQQLPSVAAPTTRCAHGTPSVWHLVPEDRRLSPLGTHQR